MSRLTLTPHDKWQSTRCSSDCVCQNGIWLTECNDPMCDIPGGYLTGKFPPNYPIPAIPTQVVFFGLDYMYDTTYIEELTIDVDGVWCSNHIVCLWDWNFDRNIDFGTPLGEMQMFFHNRLKGTNQC